MTALACEQALSFACAGETLVGVLHAPARPPAIGVVIIVGGPQYRVGSHRQFVMLARALAAAGVAALRFDCRGMGDSGGSFPGFQALGADIAAAVDALCRAAPTVETVALWGLCDAASAICFYAPTDPRIAGIALLNPWVRTAATEAQTYLKHYYRQRVFDTALFRKIAQGKFNPIESARSLVSTLYRALSRRGRDNASPTQSLTERMAAGCATFAGPVLLVMSGRDLTAKEFDDAARASARWRGIFAAARFTRRDFPEADHTFSRRAWRDRLSQWTCEWVARLGG